VSPGLPGRVAAALKLIHPFPSLLDGIATSGLASLAGAAPDRALLLGTAMIAFQGSIGALNDLVDRDRDRARIPPKPIPAGFVTPTAAAAVAGVGLAIGLALSAVAAASVGPGVLGAAVVGVGAGYAYDLRLKATPWAWAPFAAGIPLLAIYAWLGAVGSLPVGFGLLVPLGVAIGAAVALGNGIADDERDRAVGLTTAVGRLGRRRAWRIAAVLTGLVAAVAVGSLAWIGAERPPIVGVIVGVGITLAGLSLSASVKVDRRRLGWEVEAIGFVLLGLAWTAGAVPRLFR
jgi:4-hydroxybenzoate polyprenyltransferase